MIEDIIKIDRLFFFKKIKNNNINNLRKHMECMLIADIISIHLRYEVTKNLNGDEN